MTITGLPPSPEAFAGASWDDIVPYYEWLANRPLNPDDRPEIEAWLADWSTLEEQLDETGALAYVAYTTDTADEAKESAQLHFSSEIQPRMDEQRVRLNKRLLELGYTRDDLLPALRKARNQIDLFREENIPIQAELAKLESDYNKLTGGMTVMWDGEEKTIPQMQPYLLRTDRDERERAFRLMAQPYIDHRADIAGIFDQQYALRGEMARNAGFDNFRDFSHREKSRFDYTPQDCERFHEAVEQTVVPAVARIHERRCARMGLDTLRPWDLDVDPESLPPLKPFDDVDTFVNRAANIFGRLDPVLGGHFQTMIDEGLLDLDSRKGKAPGGYCIPLPYRGRTFIFMNAVGVAEDVSTLLHEAGHAFHEAEAGALPLLWQRYPGDEMGEVGSMAMELLTAPYLAREDGGYYSPDDARRARIAHLEGILMILPHIASIDAFQHWLYTSGRGDDRDARDAAWLEIRGRFDRGVDWSGLESQSLVRWYRQLHIFLYPFYYIEYGIAQIGALQVWRNSLRDPATALANYRHALALGATRPLPELFEAAGAQLTFDVDAIGALVELVEEQLEALHSRS